jgi:hypothetical protein
MISLPSPFILANSMRLSMPFPASPAFGAYMAEKGGDYQ